MQFPACHVWGGLPGRPGQGTGTRQAGAAGLLQSSTGPNADCWGLGTALPRPGAGRRGTTAARRLGEGNAGPANHQQRPMPAWAELMRDSKQLNRSPQSKKKIALKIKCLDTSFCMSRLATIQLLSWRSRGVVIKLSQSPFIPIIQRPPSGWVAGTQATPKPSSQHGSPAARNNQSSNVSRSGPCATSTTCRASDVQKCGWSAATSRSEAHLENLCSGTLGDTGDLWWYAQHRWLFHKS